MYSFELALILPVQSNDPWTASVEDRRDVAADATFSEENVDIDKLSSILLRVFFFGAFLVFAVAVLEKLLNLVGQSVPGLDVLPTTLLGWSVVLLTFVIALLLRQIREAVKTS